jgi:pyruvate/2-oxoacid:ferredoxin oxidoreductase alpha subunit
MVIQAYRMAEQVYLPVMVCYDGYILSHTDMPVEVPPQDAVDRFLPPYRPHTILDPANPRNYNLVTLANPRLNAEGALCHGYMEIRYLLQEALERSKETVAGVGQEFGELFGRSYERLLWEDGMEGAEVAMVAAGSLAMEATVAADALRRDGIRAGVVGLRVFRPFPGREIVRAIEGCRLVVVFDKSISYGHEGAISTETKAALYGSGLNTVVRDFVVGLGGRDVKARELVDAVKKTLSLMGSGHLKTDSPEWICEI